MPKQRKEIKELEKLIQGGKKKFVRYAEGAALYSMGLHTFQDLAKEAKAVYHVKAASESVSTPTGMSPETTSSACSAAL